MKQNESAVTYWGGMLADEIIQEIIIRSPDKSIARFRLLSTKWRDRINDPWELSRHAEICGNKVALIQADFSGGETPKFFVFDTNGTLKELPIRTYEFGKFYSYNTCNGYLLLGKYYHGGPLLLIHVYNQSVIELPIGTIGVSEDLVVACKDKNDYYVLQLLEGANGLIFKILNVGQETWTEGLDLSVEMVRVPSVVLGGSTFYLGKRGFQSYLVEINMVSASTSMIRLNDSVKVFEQLCLVADGIGIAASTGNNIVIYKLEGDAWVQIRELEFDLWHLDGYNTCIAFEEDDLVVVRADGDSVARIKVSNNQVKILRIPDAIHLHCDLVHTCKLLGPGYSK